MATDNFHFDQTFTAGADLSADQYKFVKFSAADTVVLCAAVTDVPVGVLQNKPASGTAATVRLLGVSKVEAGGTIAFGERIGTDGSGLADTKAVGDTTEYVVGVAQTAAVVGDVFRASINCLNPTRSN